jgi:hypothetical protein
MHLTTMFPSKYLKASDVDARGTRFVIARVTVEEVGPEREQKPLVYFENERRGLILNRTNGNAIADICGSEDAEDWTGHTIVLVSEPVFFAGRTNPGIRVRPPSAPLAAVAPAPGPVPTPKAKHAIPVAADELNDEIPF